MLRILVLDGPSRRAYRRRSAKSQRLQSCAVNRRPNRHQKMRRTFGISSRLAHGRRVPLNHLPCAALNVLSENAQQMHRRMIYRPRHRSRPDKPLQKNKRSSPKIHPSNPSIHPNRLPQFHRSTPLPMHPRLRQSVSRSRLAAVSLHHPRRSLSSHQRSIRPPFVKSRSQASHREKNLGAAFLFGQ